MRNFQFFIGLAVGLVFFYFIATTNPPEPEIQTIIEKEYITKTEFVAINRTEPVEMTVTAYTAGPESTGKRPGDKGYGVTSTGTQARLGVCAVDPKYIPLGSSLYVAEYGYCRAEDIGGNVKGYHVDVFVEKVADALKFDPKVRRKVWILKDFGEGTA